MHQHPHKHNSQAFFNSPTFEKVAFPKMWKTDFNKSDTNEKKNQKSILTAPYFQETLCLTAAHLRERSVRWVELLAGNSFLNAKNIPMFVSKYW